MVKEAVSVLVFPSLVIFKHTLNTIWIILSVSVIINGDKPKNKIPKTIFFFNNFYSRIKIPNYIKPALAGFLTGLAGLFLPYILSSGNGSVEMLFKGELPIVLVCIIFCAKFIITPLCFGSGAAGGIFLPMLMLGSFLGYITGFGANLLGAEVNLVAISSLGMAGFLASVSRTPLTAVVMVFEMTGGYECILPLMLTAAIADMVAEKMKHKPIYTELAAWQIVHKGK